MRKLDTIQTKEKLNDIWVMDHIGPGGAQHSFLICKTGHGLQPNSKILCDIWFQKGPRSDENAQHGVIDSDLLEIVKDRLTDFQNGPYANDYNEKALHHVVEALKALNQRVEDRIERNVLGEYKK